eukprot:749737-Hanusia_phi.AAC.2
MVMSAILWTKRPKTLTGPILHSGCYDRIRSRSARKLNPAARRLVRAEAKPAASRERKMEGRGGPGRKEEEKEQVGEGRVEWKGSEEAIQAWQGNPLGGEVGGYMTAEGGGGDNIGGSLP